MAVSLATDRMMDRDVNTKDTILAWSYPGFRCFLYDRRLADGG